MRARTCDHWVKPVEIQSLHARALTLSCLVNRNLFSDHNKKQLLPYVPMTIEKIEKIISLVQIQTSY